MKQLIKKILKESAKEKFINTMVDKLKPPYFKNLDKFEVSKAERKEIFKKFFGGHVTIKQGTVFDSVGNEIYYEGITGGYWEKNKYNERGNLIYKENSSGYWEKREYDGRGNLIYYENSGGYWYKYGYDEMGNLIYREDSNRGVVVDKR